MYKSRAREWARALTSGKYPQARGALCKLRLQYDDDSNVTSSEVEGYCCLGVLCELAIKDGVKLEIRDVGEQRTYNNNSGHLPPAVMQWAGLSEANPVLIPPMMRGPDDVCNLCGGNHPGEKSPSVTAAGANDEKAMTFAEIANLVKKQFLSEK